MCDRAALDAAVEAYGRSAGKIALADALARYLIAISMASDAETTTIEVGPWQVVATKDERLKVDMDEEGPAR